MSREIGRARIRVLVVDDSPVVRALLVHLLGTDPEIQVVGTASDGKEAVDAVTSKRPDVVTMDYHMPAMNGLDATRKIMETRPLPIVIVSGSTNPGEVCSAFRLLESGALAVVAKPAGIGQPGHEAAARELVLTVKLMAEVKVVRRWPKPAAPALAAPLPQPLALDAAPAAVDLVAIGTSTGGPLVLKTILSGLPRGFPAPIAIVQHIAVGFTEGLVDWLAQTSGFPVHLVTDGRYPLPGHAYVAPDGLQMKLASDGRIALVDDAPLNGHRPSISYFFRSVATVLGRHAIGVLLTGMGKDGAEELRLMRERGAVTIVQDRESSVVHGMIDEAIQLDGATHVLSPPEIASALGRLVR